MGYFSKFLTIAVSKFFLAESAGGGESHALGQRIFKTHQVLLEISIPFFLGLYIFGEAFFGYVFGDIDFGYTMRKPFPYRFFVVLSTHPVT